MQMKKKCAAVLAAAALVLSLFLDNRLFIGVDPFCVDIKVQLALERLFLNNRLFIGVDPFGIDIEGKI